MAPNLPCSDVELTANIFFNLLLASMKNRIQPGDNYRNVGGKLSQSHMFFDLNNLMNSSVSTIGNFDGLKYPKQGGISGTIKNAASKFRLGKFGAKQSNIYCFNDIDIITSFDYQVKNEYSKALVKAIEFAKRYFDEDALLKNKILVQKVLYFILNDDSIRNDQKFYICSDGSTKTKSDLKKMIEFEFESFLLGVWHYLIVSQRLQKKIEKDKIIVDDEKFRQSNVNLSYSKMKIETRKEDASDFQSSSDDNSCNNESDSSNGESLHNCFFSKYAKKNKSKSLNNYIKSSVLKEEILPTACDEKIDYYLSEIDENADIISVLEHNDIILSRSIFFYLLSGSIQTVHPKRNKNAVERLFLDLLNLTVDNYCEIDFSKSLVRYFPDKFKYLKEISSADCLDDQAQIEMFSDLIQNNYEDVLYSMIKIREKFFHSAPKNEALVVELIEFIKNDNSIKDNQAFFVCSDGSTLTKKQLCEIEELEFEPFLLGIWHYVISQLAAKDSADEHTFDTVFKLSYNYNGKSYERYRLGDIINEQSDLYVELSYLSI